MYSGAKNTITNQLKNSPVDALEVLPAPVAPKLLDSVRAISMDIPVVGGGLILAWSKMPCARQAGLPLARQAPASTNAPGTRIIAQMILSRLSLTQGMLPKK